MGEPAAPPAPRAVKHLNSLTGIRALAALYVFMLHYEDMKDIVSPLASNGAVGVNVFFCLSGFIMAYTTKSPPSGWQWSFYLRRLARIMPAYWVSLFFHIPSLEMNLDGPSPLSKGDIFLSVIGLQTWFRPGTFFWDAPGWSVQTELAFYLMFPLLYRYRAQLVKYWWVAVGYVYFFMLLVVFLNKPEIQSMIYRMPWTRFGEFACGIIAHELRHKVNVPLLPFTIPFIGLCLGLGWFPNGALACAHGALTIPICFGLAQLANDDESGKDTYVNRFLGHKHMVFLGEISYSFYLIHTVWRPMATKIGYPDINQGGLDKCVGPCLSLPYLSYSLVTAVILHTFVELPFYTRAIKYLKNRTRTASSAVMPGYLVVEIPVAPAPCHEAKISITASTNSDSASIEGTVTTEIDRKSSPTATTVTICNSPSHVPSVIS